MLIERTGLIVWVNDYKAAKALEKFGSLHYVSKKMRYAVLYIASDREAEVVAQLEKLNFVKKIERSYRNEIRTEYNSTVPDKTRFYTL